MATKMESSIVRIQTHDNRVVGAGFLVTEKLVLTCAHVVAQVLDIPQDTPDIPTGEIYLDFPLVAAGKTLPAKVITWLPVQPDGSRDIACLFAIRLIRILRVYLVDNFLYPLAEGTHFSQALLPEWSQCITPQVALGFRQRNDLQTHLG